MRQAWRRLGRIAILSTFLATPTLGGDPASSIVAEGVPPVPASLDGELAQYRFRRPIGRFQGWLAGGRKVLFLDEIRGIPQVFLIDEPGGITLQLTHQGHPVSWAHPNPRQGRFVFAADNEGDENDHLFLFDLETDAIRRFANGVWMNQNALWSRSGQQLALSSNARNGKDLDLYIIKPPSTATGRRVKEGNGLLAASAWSPDDRRIAAVEWLPDYSQTRIRLIDVATGEDQVLPNPPGSLATRTGIRWSSDGASLYWKTERDSEFTHLARYDLATGRETSLTESIPWDIDDFDLSDDGSTIVLVANKEGRSELHLLDARTGEESPAPRFATGIISNLIFRKGSREFGFQWTSARSPCGVYSYDIDSRRKSEWVRPEPCSPKAGSIGEPDLIHYPTFDGRSIPAFVRRPDRKFAGRRPVLIEIHGGPASQARPYHSGLEDFLIGELGLAIISPNVRGSTGYGRSFEKLDDGPLREDAIKDIGSLLDWIATQPDLDPSRVAVSGGSYGGFMALAAMIRYGDRLRAGIDWMGVSDFETFLKADRPMVLEAHRGEYGDERDPKIREFLRKISPLRNAREIKKPLLIIHGANDPRVKKGEAHQIVAELRKMGIPTWSILYQNEGHGLSQRDNKVFDQHVRILFLGQFLLGGGEPSRLRDGKP